MKLVYEVTGMKCKMCEKNLEDAVKEKYNLKNVKASFKKNELVINTDTEIDLNELKELVSNTGYTLIK